APMFRWPTSELPSCPSGSPTASPQAVRVVWGYVFQYRSKFGFLARATALPNVSSRRPKPSRMMSATGLRLLVMSPGPFHELDVGSGVEAGAADQRAVDFRPLHEFADVVRLHAAAVLDAHPLRHVPVVKAGDDVPDAADHFRGIFRRGRLARADGPHRFVGHDDRRRLFGGKPGERRFR